MSKKHLLILLGAIVLVPSGIGTGQHLGPPLGTGKKRILEAFPDGVWSLLGNCGPAEHFIFERNGSELVRITIDQGKGASQLGRYAIKVCGPDKFGGKRIVIRIPPLGPDPARPHDFQDLCNLGEASASGAHGASTQ